MGSGPWALLFYANSCIFNSLRWTFKLICGIARVYFRINRTGVIFGFAGNLREISPAVVKLINIVGDCPLFNTNMN